MDKEFVVTVTGLYRKFKDKDRSVVTFRHFLAGLALRYLYDAKRLPDAPVPAQDLPRELALLFKHTPPAPVAPVLDGLVAQLAGHPAFKNAFAEVSFTRWVGKDDPQRSVRLSGLVSELGGFSFGADAAEIARNGLAVGYLLEKFAEENFHKHGFLYTPKSLATLMVRLVNPSAGHTVYDPACGLGNLLVQAAREGAVPADALYGAEPDGNYRGLAHFNLFFSGLPGAQVSGKDSLAEARKLRRPAETYDCVLLHPPFGDLPLLPAQPEGLPFLFNGSAPARNGKARHAAPEEDFLSLLLRSLAATGRAAVIVPHGVLFKMGSTYQVRKLLVDHNLIDAVVDLPPNIFYSCKTNVALLVLDKARPHRDVLFVDASAHFEPDRRRNRMRPHHVDALTAVHRDFVPVTGLAARLPGCALQGAPHDYNLTPKRYVQPATAAGPDLYRLRQEMDDLHEKLGQVHAQLEDCLKALLQTT
ncbi:MAG: N-6 DNA methylase [Cytophagales bacterium]|nr:N-6 DNA methylase [Cytophagales bacterium]